MTNDTPPLPDEQDPPLTLATLRTLLEDFAHLPGDTPVALQKDALSMPR
ncbi:hypothetical protein [Streptomyces sp. NPDC046685]